MANPHSFIIRSLASLMGLSTLLAAVSVHAQVVINEVLGSTAGSDNEFIELFNSGPDPVDIGGWTVELWDSDAGGQFGTPDGVSPYVVPSGAVIDAGGFFLFANGLAQAAFGVTADVTLPSNAIENSSYTIVLTDELGSPVSTAFVTDGGSGDAANIAGTLITPDVSIGPDGPFLPAGFTRVPDGGGTLALLEFFPQPSESATPTASGNTPPGGGVAATIMKIQGAGHTSPLVGETVRTGGVVTAVDSIGYYVQDPAGDDDIATSDALFVFTFGEKPAVGDLITVTGRVSEFTPGGTATRNLSTTQLSRADFSVLGSQPLPAPVVLGIAGRVPPAENIDDDAFTAFEPETDGIDFFESLESMLVSVSGAVAVSPTNRFNEIFTVGDNAATASGISERGTLNISPDDFNPEKIQIDEDSGILPGFSFPDVAVGANLGEVVGVISYDFGNFQINPTAAFAATPSPLVSERTTLRGKEETITIATYNVLNLDVNPFDGDDDIGNGRFDAIANQIVYALREPDIVALQEIQDNDGRVDSTETSADVTLQTLVDAIIASGGPRYRFIDSEGLVPNSVGGQPGGNIRVAFLYNPRRVELDGKPRLLTDPIDQATNPNNPFFDSRIPLVATFEADDGEVTVINNHFSSKGGSAPIFGVEQPFDARQEDPSVNGSLDERQRQAEAVSAFVASLLRDDDDDSDSDSDEDEGTAVIVLGDLNEFEFVSPVKDILGRELVNLTELLPENERYSFLFQGNSQALDHVLVSPSLTRGARIDAVHVNTEFAETPSRASDHDPVVVRIRLDDDD